MVSRWINVVLGMWLFVAAWIFAREGSELANNVFLGLAIFLSAFLAMAVPGFRRVNTMLGAWAAISPFLLGYGDAPAAIDDVVVGVLVIAASLWGERADTGVPRLERRQRTAA